MLVMAVLALKFIEHQASQCCEVWWGSGVDHGEDGVGHGEDKRQESKSGKLSVAAWK